MIHTLRYTYILFPDLMQKVLLRRYMDMKFTEDNKLMNT